MENEGKKNRKNAISLLIFLSVYAFVCIYFFSGSENVVEYSEAREDYATNLVEFTNELEYKEVGEIMEEEVVVSENYEQGDVKGIQDFIDSLRDYFVGSCDDPAYEIFEPQLFCGGSGGIDAEDVKIAQIWAPDILFVGAGAPFDNLVQTSNPDGRVAFRNASEIINPDFDYFINMPPNASGAELLDSVPLEDDEKFEPYEMHYEAAGALNEIPFDVHPDEESLCTEGVVNDGEFNVKGSNNLQKELTDSITPPGIMELGNRNTSADLCREDRVIELDEDESFLLCNEGFLDLAVCKAKEIFSIRDNCDGIGDLVIDAPLGSGEICNEEDCSVRYSEAGRILNSPPSWTDELYPSIGANEKEEDYIVDDPVVITTPCYVRVDCQLCPTRCIWDISAWQHVFQLEKFYTYPGYENAMDDDLYWRGVEDEIKWRGRFGGRNY